ncbi:MAG TPA: asparagine--tRNA ligase, partial [Desulfuromonadales bacterium]|nr:asparagine--tRNA ligase [Desulfuromonadales bacterium]
MKIRVIDVLHRGSSAESCSFSGWVRSIRSSKGICFIVLNDGSTVEGIQIVAESTLANFSNISRIGTGAALTVSGALVESPASGQKWEVVAASIE